MIPFEKGTKERIKQELMKTDWLTIALLFFIGLIATYYLLT